MAQEVFKSAAIARDLKQRLEIATGEDVDQSTDSGDFPVLVLGKGADTIAIKVLLDSAGDGRLDGIGQVQVSYSPHKIYVAEGEVADADHGFRAEIMNEVTKCGTRILIREQAVAAGGVDASDVEDDTAFETLDAVADIKSDLINPLTSQQ